MKIAVLDITTMKAGFKFDYAEVLTECFKRLGILVSVDGKFIDIETKCLLRENKVRCMLRNDYINTGHGKLDGKFLVSIIGRYLIGMKNAAEALADLTESEHTYYIEAFDTYLE